MGGGSRRTVAADRRSTSRFQEDTLHSSTLLSRTSRNAGFAACLLAVAALWPATGSADGALAVGVPADVAKEGFAYGFALNRPSAEDAERNALSACRQEHPSIDKRAQALCKVVHTFKNQCFAVAMDPKDETPGVGWALAADPQAARKDALDKCMQTAGADRKEFCEVTHAGCDGPGR
jgi:hypothetical protein